jgi:hypothetical protein
MKNKIVLTCACLLIGSTLTAFGQSKKPNLAPPNPIPPPNAVQLPKQPPPPPPPPPKFDGIKVGPGTLSPTNKPAPGVKYTIPFSTK